MTIPWYRRVADARKGGRDRTDEEDGRDGGVPCFGEWRAVGSRSVLPCAGSRSEGSSYTQAPFLAHPHGHALLYVRLRGDEPGLAGGRGAEGRDRERNPAFFKHLLHYAVNCGTFPLFPGRGVK